MRSVAGVVLGLVLVGCAAEPGDGEDVAMTDDAALTALEDQIGFDGAIGRLDIGDLEAIDAQATHLEASGASASAIDTAATKSTLRAALGAKSTTTTKALRPETLHPTFDVYDSDLFKLNGLEQALCKAHRIVCVRVAISAFKARGASQAEFHDGNVGGRIDCFRHTYWNASMTRAVGADYAKQWGDAHENGYPENRATKRDALLSDMDFFNNNVGRTIAQKLEAAHAKDSDDATKQAVRTAIERGDVRAVRYDLGERNGKLVPSSQCSDTVHCGT